MNKDAPQLSSWIQSSMDPAVVSTTIKGLAATLGGTLLLVLALSGHPASSDQFGTTVDQVATLGGQLATGLGAAYAIYGLIMKAIMWFHGPVVKK